MKEFRLQKTVYTLLGLLCCVVGFAQSNYYKGYVIQLNGDTIKGEVRINPKKQLEQYQKVAFKDEKGLPKNYKPEKIKGYGYDNFSFISTEHEGEKVFIKLLSSGAINLFDVQFEVLIMNDIKTKTDYLMMKNGNDSFVRIKSGKMKKQLSDVMSDDAELVKQIEANKNLELENMVEVFNKYNVWASAR